MRRRTERSAEPPPARPPHAVQALTHVDSKHFPGRSPTRSQGRRKPVPGGSGRGVHAADGLGNEPRTARAGAGSALSRARSVVARAQAPLRVEVQYARRPLGVPGPVALRRWARAAHAAGVAALSALASKRLADAGGGAITLRVVGNAESQRLNRGYRGKDKPTNVLSFPASMQELHLDGALGDLVLCAPVVAREAREQRKSPAAHWAHMVVHGTLHLLGYDHERPRAVRVMESLEVEILRGLGFHDPYAGHAGPE